ncbi:MAG: ParB/RepB/Spo0J family partition protein [Anaerovoracaceae bacterium]
MAKPKKTGLGRGLDALFDTVEVSPEPEKDSLEGIARLNIDDIKPNINQPRKTFDEEKIKDLANSISEHGVIQPIVVRATQNGHEIVAGERRWRAARVAGLKEVPCVVRELTDEQNMLFAIIENMQREDLNPIEEAEGLERMISTFGLTQAEVSKSVGKSRPYITNSLRLLKLPDVIKDFMVQGDISVGHGRALITIEDEDKQVELAKKVIKDGLSVRNIEDIAAGKKPQKRGKPAKRTPKGSDVIFVERELKRALGTKVNINMSGDKGKIEIEYFSRDELERLIELLRTV